jgi:cobalt-zinc-cadmium efflux system outer membrane protein
MNRFRAAIGLLLWPVSGSAITLEQALSMAAEQHPQLRAGNAQIEVAQAGILTAKAYPNPQFATLAGGQTYRVPGNVSGYVQSFSFTQPLEIGPLRATRVQLAERGRDSAQQILAEIRLGLLSAVRRTWFFALRRREEIEILNDNLRLVEELRKRIQVRVEVGEAGRLELVRAETEVVTARTAVTNSRLQYVTALSQLRAAIGLPPDADLNPEGTLEPPSALPALEDLRKQALERHPALSFARAEIRRAEARLTYETAARRPQPSVRAEIDRPPDTPTYRFGVEIPLPFWNRREGPIAEAAAEIKQRQALAQSRQVELLAGLENAYGRYQAAVQQLQAYEQGILRAADEAVRAAETAYQLGERGIVEVLDAQRALRTVRLDFLNAQYDRQAALVDLDELRAMEPGKK